MVQRRGARFRNPYPQLPALDQLGHRFDRDVVDGIDDAFAEREPGDEILEVAGRGHHHRERGVVVDEGDRYLFGDGVIERARDGSVPAHDVAPGTARHRTVAGAFVGG